MLSDVSFMNIPIIFRTLGVTLKFLERLDIETTHKKLKHVGMKSYTLIVGNK